MQSHYSVKGAAASLGLGTDNCREVEVDSRGRMRAEHLEQLIAEDLAQGRRPFFVNCTAGTTVLGAFDPINAIADICEQHGVWLHVDVGARTSASKRSILRFVITEKAPTRAFSWLKASNTAFTFKTLLRHYTKGTLTPQSLNVKLGPRRKSHKGRVGWLA